MATPTSASVLAALAQTRLVELARSLGVTIPTSGRNDAQVSRLVEAAKLPLPGWLGHLYRDESRTACREHDLAIESRSRTELAAPAKAAKPRAKKSKSKSSANQTSLLDEE